MFASPRANHLPRQRKRIRATRPRVCWELQRAGGLCQVVSEGSGDPGGLWRARKGKTGEVWGEEGSWMLQCNPAVVGSTKGAAVAWR